MEKKSTKDQILDVALDLFSVKGFEATSISQIADAVGIKKASLYSHFASKQDILDSLVSRMIEKYEKHSILVSCNWEDPDFTKDKNDITPEAVGKMIKGHISYIIHDPEISMGRRILTIEQFQNSELKVVQSKQSYDDVNKFCTGLMKFLIKKGALKEYNPEIMAAQFAWPISMWTCLCDREPEREKEAMDLIDRHINQFFEIYRR